MSSRRRGEARRRFFAVAVVLTTYALAGATLVYEGSGKAPAPHEEIPVEIIVEPPPPPPTKPTPTATPEAEAPKPPVDLAPAFDAPRAGEAETDTGDKEKDSKPPPAPAAEDKSAERDSGAQAKAEAPKTEAPPTPEPTEQAQPAEAAPPLKSAEGEVPPPAPPAPQPTPSPTPVPQPQATEAPSPAPPSRAAGKSAPLFASVPEVDFGGAAMKSPVSGGSARSTYTAILLGSILPHFHKPPGGRSTLGGKSGVVNFSVDGQGRLVNRYISEESGLPELDRAAVEAVGAASPFPPPPRGVANGTFSWYFGKQ